MVNSNLLRLFVGQPLEREAPLEAQRPERENQPEPESPRGADVEEALGREARVRDVVRRGGGGVAVELLEVPGVAQIREDDAA